MDKAIIGLLSGASALALIGGAQAAPAPTGPSSPQARSPSYWTRFRAQLNFSTRTTSTLLQTPRPLSARWNWRSIIIIITITTIIITITTITMTTTTITTIDGRPGAADGTGLPSVV
jgi:hypothetical protein